MNRIITIIIVLVGLGLIASAFISPTLQLAAALAGVGFIGMGLLLIRREQDRQREEERYRQIITKLEEIKQELEKEERPKNTGVAIADVISSGLKYYTEHIASQKKEEKDD